MKFRTGVILGFAAGYVLGAKAGRERYEQIRTAWERVSTNPQIQAMAEKAGTVAEQPLKRVRSAVGKGLDDAGAAIESFTDPAQASSR